VIRWLVLAAAAGVATAGCGARSAPAGPAAPAPLVVGRGTLEDRLVLSGEIEASSSEHLVVPRTPSWMLSIRWLAADGSMVRKGDRVVEFDSSSLTTTLEDKRGAIIRSQGELDSQVARDRATLADKEMEVERRRAEREKARIEAGVPPDLYSRRQHQEKQLALLTRQDALAKAEEDLRAQRRSAGLERRIKEVALARAVRELAEVDRLLDELTLRAPRDGLVQLAINRREGSGRKYLVGDQAFPGWAVATMPDLSAIQVRARLADVDDGAVREGMPADCVLDAYPGKVWKAMVRQVSPVARSEGRDSTRRFFDVVVKLDAPAVDIMRPGMSMRVEVLRRRAENTLLVPRAAVAGWPGKARVRLASGQEAAAELEWCSETACVLRGGLSEGTALLASVPGAGGPS
jgi:multidrug efflux pump subunit AcrA (membrane-fusion protein)